MFIRVFASGCVEDVFEPQARCLIAAGVAEEVKATDESKSGMPELPQRPAIQTAMANPVVEKAVAIRFIRGPITLRGLFGRT